MAKPAVATRRVSTTSSYDQDDYLTRGYHPPTSIWSESRSPSTPASSVDARHSIPPLPAPKSIPVPPVLWPPRTLPGPRGNASDHGGSSRHSDRSSSDDLAQVQGRNVDQPVAAETAHVASTPSAIAVRHTMGTTNSTDLIVRGKRLMTRQKIMVACFLIGIK
jgi:hypothetical protein